MRKYIYVLSIITENTLRVLQRMAGIFARHRLNIEQLNVFGTTQENSVFNIVIHSEEKKIELVIKQLERIFEVDEVKVINRIPIGDKLGAVSSEYKLNELCTTELCIS